MHKNWWSLMNSVKSSIRQQKRCPRLLNWKRVRLKFHFRSSDQVTEKVKMCVIERNHESVDVKQKTNTNLPGWAYRLLARQIVVASCKSLTDITGVYNNEISKELDMHTRARRPTIELQSQSTRLGIASLRSKKQFASPYRSIRTSAAEAGT